jgi:hypothetical protein
MEPSRMGSSFSVFMKRNAAEIFQNSKVMSILSTLKEICSRYMFI